MELTREEKQEIKTAFGTGDYSSRRMTKPQKRILKRYGIVHEEDRGKAYFIYNRRRMGSTATGRHGRAGKNLASSLIKLIED